MTVEESGLYAGWTSERWETPVSDVPVLFFESLIDDGSLHIRVADVRGGKRWRFTFTDAPGYANLLEEYRLALWQRDRDAKGLGWTVRVPNSPWLAYLRRTEALLDVHHPGLQHFQIGTETAVIDVVAQGEPEIAEEPSPAAGGARVV
jgi:hypothetical protein